MRLSVAVAAGLLLCGCSTAVAGHGEYLGGGTTATTVPTSTPPSTTASPTPTPTPPPVRYDPGRRMLACRGGQVLVPKGGPYCYLVPAGLRNVTGQVKLGTGTGAARYVTSVGLAGRDVIVVLAYRTPLDTDLLPNARIVADLRGVLGSLAK